MNIQKKEEAEKLLKRRLEAGVITSQDYKEEMRKLQTLEVVYTKTSNQICNIRGRRV